MINDTLEKKILRCVSPVLVYLFATMIVQIIFTMVVTAVEFMSMHDDGLLNYMVTYNFAGDIEQVVSENGLVVTLFSGLITIPICLIMMKKDQYAIKPITLNEYVHSIKMKGWYLIVFIGVTASAGLSKLVTLFPLDGILGNYEETQNNFASNPLIMQILVLVILAPVTEEIIFRGLVYQRIKRYTNNEMTPVYISAIAFGVYHFNLVQGIYAAALGILLCFVYEKYNTVLAPVILHISANLMALIMMYLPVSSKIESNIYLKILVMIFEIAALVAVIWKTNMGKEKGK